MPVFRWKGYDGKGKQVQGVRDADSPRSLRQVLRRDGILLTDVSEAQVGGAKSKNRTSDPKMDGVGQGLFVGLLVALNLGFVVQAFAEYRRTAKPMEVAVLTRQLGTLLRAGVQLSESLAALIEQAASLSAYARRLTGGGADADDLLQDTMLRCWTARASFAAGTSLAAWTRTVMKNCFLTGRRRARFHADLPEDARDRRASRGWYARQR